MRTRIAESLAAAAAVTLLLCPARAAAQQQFDTNPPPPNVLILLDNSGSMERMIDGTIPESDPAATCNCDPVTGDCGGYTYNPKPNRWNTVQTALTGDLTNGFNCVAMPRTPGSNFTNEYQIGGKNPYDTNYPLAFHRMVAKYTNKAGTTIPCVVAPGVLPGTTAGSGVSVQGFGGGAGTLATDFSGAIINRKYPYSSSSTSTGGDCVFEQFQNGAIGTMTDLMRFGLMTFDPDPNAGTGVNPDGTVAISTACDSSGMCGAFAGMWSYFPTWNSSSPMCPYQGNPVNCTQSIPWAVGARNPAAPAWEGRMVGFPTPTGSPTVNNNNVASVILASRPFGATPLAGMFTDAQYYFQTDPTGPGAPGGGDPLVQGGCRPEYIILLTDGAPNYDLRPDCAAKSTSDAGTPGLCPFKLPEEIAASLYNGGQRSGSQQFVKTYVIGFAVSSYEDQAVPVACSTLVSNGQLTAAGQAKCASTDPATQAAVGPCCELERIAVAGGTNQAYFANSTNDLQQALGAILADIAKNATTRTTPAFSGVYTTAVANTSSPQTNASAYLASFNPSPGRPWSGDVVRQRYDCTFAKSSFTVPAQKIDSTLGDDFAANLNSASAAGSRVSIVMQPDPVSAGSTIDATVTMRPYVGTTPADGLGNYGATAFKASPPSAVLSHITPDVLGIPMTGATTGCPYTPNNAPGTTKYLGASDNGGSCRDMLLDFTFGQSFTGPSDFTFVSRTANAFADVFHATPAVVGPPAGLLQDPSYVGFRTTWGGLASASATPREQIVYVATNDGLLHAFWADETKLENNERWAMLLPAAMPGVLATYPAGHHFLLDGSPVVRDVVWDRSTVNSALPSPWHTMLVAGYGPYARGYYAVDVTNPDPSGLPPSTASSQPYDSLTGKPLGPVFRWQLTKMPSTNYKIFGDQAGTPAITTLFMDPGDGSKAREIGVAILPGGVDKGGPTSSASSGPSCQRQSSIQKRTGAQPLDTNFAYRDSVRCWGPGQKQADAVNGRSLTIVRVDTGEILRVFTRLSDVPAGDTLKIAGRIIDTPLDSPMTGTPIVYPADVGGIATKVFAGDADGTIWRFDLSNTDPSKWVGQIFLDLYNNTADSAKTTNWADGQPFDVAPVLSTTSAGEVVLNVASGAIETFDSNGKYYVYSITEKVQGTASTANDTDDPTPTGPKLRAFVNWWLGPASTPVALRAGERVSGPMTVFDRVLYFATYFAGDPTVVSCTNGSARLWGFDYVTPLDTTNCPTDSTSCGQGGARRFPATAPTDFVDPVMNNGVAQGAVIPGVSIRATPACASLTSSTSSYVGGGHSSTSNFSGGSFSLFATVGASGGTGTGGLDIATIPTPASPTLIDSWAAVLE